MKPRKESPEAYARWIATRRERRRKRRDPVVVLRKILDDAADQATVALVLECWGNRERSGR